MTSRDMLSMAPGASIGVYQRLVFAFGERTVDVVIATPGAAAAQVHAALESIYKIRRALDLKLKREAQEQLEEGGMARAAFIRVFGRSYLP